MTCLTQIKPFSGFVKTPQPEILNPKTLDKEFSNTSFLFLKLYVTFQKENWRKTLFNRLPSSFVQEVMSSPFSRLAALEEGRGPPPPPPSPPLDQPIVESFNPILFCSSQSSYKSWR